MGTGGQVNRVSPTLDLLASHSIRWLYTEQKWDQPRYPLLMFVAPSRSYVMPLVKCSSRTVKSKDTINQCCFQCNASSNMNQWHFFSCPAKFPIKISCFFSIEMQLSWSAYSPGASRPTLMLLNFIATNEEDALWVSFSDGSGTGAGALFLKKEEEEAASSWDIASF